MRNLWAGTALAAALLVTGPALAKPGDPGREKVVAAIKADHAGMSRPEAGAARAGGSAPTAPPAIR